MNDEIYGRVRGETPHFEVTQYQPMFKPEFMPDYNKPWKPTLPSTVSPRNERTKFCKVNVGNNFCTLEEKLPKMDTFFPHEKLLRVTESGKRIYSHFKTPTQKVAPLPFASRDLFPIRKYTEAEIYDVPDSPLPLSRPFEKQSPRPNLHKILKP